MGKSRNKKILFFGDIFTNTGPGIANKMTLKCLKKIFLVYENNANKILNMITLPILLLLSDIVFIASKSRINFLLIKISKLFSKKIIYLMHGYSTKEAIIEKKNNKYISKCKKYDNFIMKNCDLIVFVSENFKNYMIDEFPKFKNKFKHINNTMNTCNWKNFRNNVNNEFMIVSAGGDRLIKNNIIVAKAILELVEEGYDICYHICGSADRFTALFKNNKSIILEGNLLQDDFYKLLNRSNLYIQNSTFEAFGMAVIEAFSNGNDILISKNVGALSIFTNISNNNIIYNINSIEEIKSKIKQLIENPTFDVLKSGNVGYFVSEEYQTKCLKTILDEILTC